MTAAATGRRELRSATQRRPSDIVYILEETNRPGKQVNTEKNMSSRNILDSQEGSMPSWRGKQGATRTAGGVARRRARSVGLLGAALISWGLAAVSMGEEIPIFGLVTDTRGRPLVGAEVTLHPVVSDLDRAQALLGGDKLTLVESRTGDDGAFEILAPEPGLFTLRASFPGKATLELVTSPIFESTTLTPARLPVARPLDVQLHNAEGEAIAARVRLSRVQDRPSSFSNRGFQSQSWNAADLRLATETGSLRFDIDPEAKYRLEVVADQLLPFSEDLEKPRRKAFKPRLRKGSPLTLRAIDPQGKPVAGAMVFLADGVLPLAVTNPEGLAEVTWAKGEETKLRLLTSGAEGRIELPRDLPEDEQEPIVVAELEPGQTSSGKVIDAKSRDPLPNAIVFDSSHLDQWAFSDSQGLYTLPLDPGKARVLRAAALGYQSAVEWTEGAEARGPTFSLEPASALEGRVVDTDSNPIAGAEIEAKPLFTNQRRRLARQASGSLSRSQPDGRFRITGLVPDDGALLRVSKTGYGPKEVRLEAPIGREPVRVVMTKGLIGKGRVVNEDDQPIAGAEIFLRPADPSQNRRWASFGQQREETPADAVSDAEGLFEIRDLAAGRFDLEARADDFAPTHAPGLEIPEEVSPIDLGTLVMTPGARLQGKVVDPQGQPIVDAMVLVVEQRSRMPATFLVQLVGQQEPDTTTDVEGRFTISDRTRGEAVHLVIGKDGFLPQVLASVRAPTEKPLRVTLRRGSSVSGRVIDDSGLPVAAALVMVHPEGGGSSGRYSPSSRQTNTDEDGTFEVDNVEPGNATVTTRASGFQEFQLSGLEVPADRPLTDLQIELEAGATIRGTVTLADGSPAIDAFVMLGDHSGTRQNKGFAATDGEGHYELTGIPYGNHRLSATDTEGRRAATSVILDRDELEVDLVFEEGVEVSGWVRTEQGQPVSGVEVYLREERRTAGFRMGNLGNTTGPDGTFRIGDVRPGSYRLRASKEGFVAREQQEVIEVDVTPLQGLEVVLTRGATVSGRILGLEYDDMVKVQIRALSRGGQMARPDYEGRFSIPNLPTGSVILEAEIPGTGRRVQETVPIPEGTVEVEQDLEFGTGYTLTGSVYRSDEPLPGMNIYVSRRDGPGSSAAVTGQDGTFRIEGLEEGSYDIRVRSFDNGLSDRREIELTSDEDIRIDLFTGRISGFVRDADDSSPINDAVLRLESADPDNPGLRDQASSDVRGYFSFGEVSEGRFNVRAIKTGYATDEITVEVADGSNIDDLELALEATEGIRFEVLQPSGRPLESVRAAVLGPSGERIASGIFETTDGGLVEISTVPPGNWELLLQGGQSAVSSFRVTSPGNPGALTLQPAAILNVSVAELDSDPVSATARLVEAGGSSYRRLGWTGTVSSEISVQSGRFQVSDLAPGFWTVTVEAQDGRTWTGSIQVGPGVPAQLDIP